MILSDVFDRFIEQSPVSVMARALIENALPPSAVDALFEAHAQRQYTRTLLFSDLVDLMATVVCKIRPSINAAYKKHAEALGVTRKAVYDKIDRTEPALGAALVRHVAQALGPVVAAMGGRAEPWLAGYRPRILDGSHLPGTEHRIKPLRSTRAGALPGQALVIYDPEAGLVLDAIPCEDGHAQERSMTDEVLAKVGPGELWVGDRNFCTTRLLWGIHAAGGRFAIRQHGSTLAWWPITGPADRGRCDTGTLSEGAIGMAGPAGKPGEPGEMLVLRRVSLSLEGPTRDGEAEIHILTDLAESEADAAAVAEIYRRRWRIETAFAEIQATLAGEIASLGYPKAALFGFCVALVAFNVMGAVKAAIRAAHGAKVAEEVSGSDLAEEVAGTTRGMIVAIPEDEWVAFHGLPPEEMGRLLVTWAGLIRLSEYRKQRRGPKKPRPERQSGAKMKHVAASKLLRDQKK